jgi:uncharacterized protein (DUF3084 family)
MKKSELKQFIREEIISTLSEAEQGIIHTKDQNKAVELAKKGLNVSIDEKKKSEDEDEDIEVKDDWNKVEKEDSFVEKEPTAKDLKKGDKVTKMAAKLAMVTKEMKSVVSQWKKAEGSEKDRLLNRLKELTKVKKELDAFITPTIGTDED